MATHKSVRIVDDLDGSDAAGTVKFSVDGASYEIDLSEENAAKLREAFAPYVAAGRKVNGRGKAAARVAGGTSPRLSTAEAVKIRVWARDNGHEVSERGRIPKVVLKAYRAAA